MVQRWMCKGKIHRATVTEARLDYVGSVTIDTSLMKLANIEPFEMVQITNLRNAVRWKTYAIAAPEGSGKICLNGPPALLFEAGDLVIILSMGLYRDDELHLLKPTVVFVDANNQLTKVESHDVLIQQQDNGVDDHAG
jgi:aspartate 1-decarboxylase